ncbi:hypothetical protein [Kingella denitrificans]|uniref:hypothetical protein n=1 Tax=Kingella denitrificans TaxID=502 RepID=UPI0028D6D9C5|nr:hypothetical protein [Kingella denitrificans]
MAAEVMVQAAFEGEVSGWGTGCLAGVAPVGLNPLAESRSDNGAGVQAAFWGKRACFGDKRVGNVWISVPRR